MNPIKDDSVPHDSMMIKFIESLSQGGEIQGGAAEEPEIPNFPLKGWGLSAKLGKHSAIWGKLGTALQAYTLNPSTKFPPNPTSRKVNT